MTALLQKPTPEKLLALRNHGLQFVKTYYNAFDTNRAALKDLYEDVSQCHVEKECFVGVQPIMEKWMSLPPKLEHVLSEDGIQVQESIHGGALIFVTGGLKIDGSPNQIKFSQVFHLRVDNGKTWLVNDMFAMNYA